MQTKLSFSSVQKYNECSLCYYLHYFKGVRPAKIKSAFVFGSALDMSFNELLKNRNLHSALDIFNNQWNKIKDKQIEYSKTDPDWEMLQIKGCAIINTYYEDILPKIKEVIAIQEPVSIKNKEGDEIQGILDLIIKTHDDKIYLMDNKTAQRKYMNQSLKSCSYHKTSAKESDQLALYYYIVKNKYKLDGVGFNVLCKDLTEIKECKNCGQKTNGREKTCNNELQEEVVNEPRNFIHKRCNGQFQILYNEKVETLHIFNQIETSDEERVLKLFDDTNYGISNEIFSSRHNPERGKYGFCPYKEYYENSPDFVIKK